MAKDSAAVAIAVGDTINFVGTVVAITEPGADNTMNIWVSPNNKTVKNNAGATLFSNAACIKFHGSQLTK
jgi:hypothetical protein